MHHFFNSEAETMPLDQLRTRQNQLLADTVRYVLSNNAYYREHYAKAGLRRVSDFKGLGHLQDLPMISKEDLRTQYPLGLCCVSKETLREIHMSSGSTGTPIAMPYTAADLDQWAECMARCYVMAGAVSGDPVQITPSFGLFNGGFGMYHGARKANLFVIPTGSGNTERQIRLAREFGTRIFCGVVSYAVRVIELLHEYHAELPNLKIGVFGAESFSDSMKKTIEEQLHIEAFDIYGMTETGGVGTLGMDCPDHSGIHVWEDQYIIEIVNPATGKSVPDGEVGEVVATSLTRQALPVIRFRTGDLSKIVSREKCACGRTHVKINSIVGRTDDMLIIKGVNFFPKQVEDALMEIPGVLPHYQIIIEEKNGVKDIRVNVEAEEGVSGFVIEKHLKEKLGFSPKGDVFKPGELPRQDGKAKRVFFE